jgi:hypothetical protein
VIRLTRKSADAGQPRPGRLALLIAAAAFAVACADESIATRTLGPTRTSADVTTTERDPGTFSPDSAAMSFGLSANADRSSSAARLTPGARASTVILTTSGLQRFYSEVGKLTLSVDGVGTSAQTASIRFEKPVGATVHRAFFFSAATSLNAAQLIGEPVTLQGTRVTWDQAITNSFFANAEADVTALVKSTIDAAPAGIGTLTVGEGSGTGNIDGEVLAVVFDDPNQTTDKTVSLLFGGQKTTGDNFTIALDKPLDLSDPALSLQMGVGIGFGFQGTNNLSQSSTITVNGTTMTTCAGGQDDGQSANGALITVGGIGDSPNAPDCSGAAGDRSDDELYDLKSFVHSGDTQIAVHTVNPSNDDNIFFASLQLSVTAQVVVTGQTDNTPPVITPTVTGTLSPTGWYTDDVHVSFSVVDNESAITAQSGCTASVLNTNTASQTFTCSATSAGGSDSKSVTVKRDATVPALTATPTGTIGLDQWYTSDVSIAWGTNAPGPSGITTTCPTAAVLNTDTAGQDFSCTATTGAGLSSTSKVTIKRDASTPLVTGTPTGPLNLVTGWYTGDAQISWSAVAAGPSGASATCPVVTVNTDTPGQTFSCVATTGAGLTGKGSVTLKRDATIPTVTGAAQGSSTNGWFTSDVVVHWTQSPAGISGIVTTCPDATLSTDTPSQIFGCTETTGAGISAIGKVEVKRDASHPSVVASTTGHLSTTGWYTDDAHVSWSATANGPSGATSNCVVATLNTNTAGQAFSCTATSGAGLTTTGTTTIRRDATMPVVTGSTSGPQGANDWFTGTVTIGWSVSLPGPSGQSAICGQTQFASDSPNETRSCTVTTGATLAGTGTVNFKRDASAPALAASVAGTPGNNGWYRSDVTVSWAASDPTSGAPAVPCAANVLNVDSGPTTYSCTATNGAGEQTAVQQTVKRDVTPPSIAYTNNAGSYTVDQTVAVNCVASDATSGLATNTCAAVNGAAYTFGLGVHAYTASASDNAGNSASANTSFTVVATDASVCALVNRFVSNSGVANSLCVKLNHQDYEPFKNELSAQTGKQVSDSNAAILLTLVNALEQQ